MCSTVSGVKRCAFVYTKPCWVTQTTHRPLIVTHWLKTIGISMNWSDMSICSSLSIRSSSVEVKEKRTKKTQHWVREGKRDSRIRRAYNDVWQSKRDQTAIARAALNLRVGLSTYTAILLKPHSNVKYHKTGRTWIMAQKCKCTIDQYWDMFFQC